MDNFEIERKFLIRYPEKSLIDACGDVSEIVQTYLLPGKDGGTERVRKRGKGDKFTYTHTIKKRISDVRRVEIENEVSEEEYKELLGRADPQRNTIYKIRALYYYKEQMFEIDLYPFWSDRAVMELELEGEGQEICFPQDIEIIREISSDKRYTNASLARKVPYDKL